MSAPLLNLADVDIDPALVRRLPSHLAYFHVALPIADDEDTITVAFAQPDNHATRELIENTLGHPVVAVRSRTDEILGMLDRVWQDVDLPERAIYLCSSDPLRLQTLSSYVARVVTPAYPERPMYAAPLGSAIGHTPDTRAVLIVAHSDTADGRRDLVVRAPAAVWLVARHPHVTQQPLAALTDPVIWLLLVAGAAYAPMTILIGAAGGSLLDMLNPVQVVRAASQLGPPYFATVLLLGALFVPGMLLLAVGAMLNALPLPFVPRVLDYALACYVPFVAARMLGLLLYTHGDRVGYGVEADYRVPVLPGVQPRGVAPPDAEPVRKARAPIELEPEPAPLVEAEVERPKELDPDALPELKGD